MAIAAAVRRAHGFRRLTQLAILSAVLAAISVGVRATLTAEAQAGGYAAGFDLRGIVNRPRHLSMADLQQYPSSTASVTFLAGNTTEHISYTGVLLWTLLNASGVQADAHRKNDLLRKYVVVTGSDGYQAVIAVAEMLPDYGNQPIMVAYRRDGAALGTDEGMARLVVPGDRRGGRYVDNIVSIEVRNAGL